MNENQMTSTPNQLGMIWVKSQQLEDHFGALISKLNTDSISFYEDLSDDYGVDFVTRDGEWGFESQKDLDDLVSDFGIK